MSLLKKASIITTPTAYAEDFLYNIKPAGGLGDELVTNGDYTNGLTGWSTQIPSGQTVEVTNNQLHIDYDHTGTQGSTGVNQTILTSGITYKIVVDIVSITGTLRIQAGGQVQDISTSGTHTFYKTPTSTILYIIRSNNGESLDVTINSISVKEVLDFDFDRNSTGTRVNEDYLIEDVPYNLLSYTEELTNVYWNKVSVTVTGGFKDPFYGNNAFKVVDTSGGGTAYLHKPSIASSDYGRSIYARTVSGTGTVSLLSYYGNTNSVFTLTEKWQRFYVNSVTTTTGRINYYAVDFRSGDLTEVLLYAPQLTKSPTLKDYLKTTDRLDIPRIDYTNGEPSILLEPSRTNNITQSTNFNGWNLSNVAISSNAIASPEGINNASKIYPTSTTTAAYAYLSVTGQTTSIYAKKGERNWIMIYGGFANTNAYFNLDKGEFGTVKSQVQDYNFISYPNEWYRINITYTSNATQVRVYNVDGDNNLTSTPNGTDGIYIYGAQNEAGSYATSLIHTSGSAVTRSKDSFPNPLGADGTPTGNKAVIYLEIASTPTTPLAQKNFIGFVNGTTNQYGLYHWGQTDNNKFGFNTWNGDAYGITGADYLLNGEYNKIAGLFDFTNFTNNKLYINGKRQSISQVRNVTVQRSAAGLGITAPTSNQDPVGNYKCVMMFDQELTDEELEKLTGYNNHELYMNYYNRLSYLGLVEEYNVESDINNYIL